MKSATYSASRLALAIVALALASCGTVTEKTNVSTRSSYDPQDTVEPTSGIFDFWKDERGAVVGRIVSLNYEARFETLREMYGDQFEPALAKEDFEPTKWRDPKSGKDRDARKVTKSTHTKMGQMVQWKKDGRIPTSGFKKLLNKFTKKSGDIRNEINS